MNYEKAEILNLMDARTIQALCRLYGIEYKHLGMKLGCTRQNIFHKLKHNRFKSSELEIIHSLFTSLGMETVELILLHEMTKKQKRSVQPL